MSGFSCESRATFLGGSFDFNISGVSDPGALIDTTYVYANSRLALLGVEFKGFATGYKLFGGLGAWATSANPLSVIAEDCSGLALPASYAGLTTATVFIEQERHEIVFSSTKSGTLGLRIEDTRGVAEWLPNDSTAFPYLSSTFQGSGVPWSLRLLWFQSAGLSAVHEYKSPPLKMINQLADAVRSFTLKALIPAAVIEGIRVDFNYIDTTGIARHIGTEIIGSSGAAWSNAGSYPGHVAKEFAVTTPTAVKSGAEVHCAITLNGTPPDAVSAVYIDPEFVVT
jgi:hypothetical protein